MANKTTHIICADCGGDNEVLAYHPSDGTLEIITIAGYHQIWLTCKHCGFRYVILEIQNKTVDLTQAMK